MPRITSYADVVLECREVRHHDSGRDNSPSWCSSAVMHVLPAGFHRIRYYGLLASGQRAENVARARQLLMPPIIPVDAIKGNQPQCCR